VAEQNRNPLTERAILDAALQIADERGLDAISMRAVADRVGVTPMALYPHIGSKAALLDGIVDRMLAEFLPTSAPSDLTWRDRLRQVGHGARELARRHPAGFTLLFARPAVTRDAVRVVDIIYGAMLDAGVPDAQVLRLERLFTTFCLGYAMSEVNGRFGGARAVRGVRGDVAPGSVPSHVHLATYLAKPVDWDAEYATDLEDLIELIADVAAASA
jgi:AcrR family transcriptional regulator